MNATASSSPCYRLEHAAFRDAMRRFVAREIAPHVETWEAQSSFPVELYRKAAGIGLLGLGFPEAYGGSDVANLKTAARRDGEHFVLNGSKTFITSGMRADFYTVAVRTGGAEEVMRDLAARQLGFH